MGTSDTDGGSCGLYAVIFIVSLADQTGDRSHTASDQAQQRAIGVGILVKPVVFNFELAVSPKRNDRLIGKSHL